MGFIPAPGCVKADMTFMVNGQQMHNIIWCKRDSAWTEEERAGLAGAILTWWADSNTNSYFYNGVQLVQVDVINQDSQNAPKTTVIPNPAVSGTGGTTMAGDNATCLVATLRTNLRGRSYRGRMYLGGHRGAAVQDGIKAVLGQVTGIITFLGALKTLIEGLGATWVVISKYFNKSARPSAVATPITAISVDQYWDAQRRRLGLRGV